jgi:purine-binding chemotaxis protein CheW
MAEKNKKAIQEVIRTVAEQSVFKKEIVERIFQLVIFELDKEEYAVPISDLREIIRIPDITSVPNSPEFIKGIFNLRGKIVVVVDLEKRFNLVREYDIKPEHIIITKVDENIFGVIVDKVTEILQTSESSIQKAPSLISSKIHSDFIRGVVVLEEELERKNGLSDEEKLDKGIKRKKTENKDNRLIILIDLPKMLSEKELTEIGDLTREINK